MEPLAGVRVADFTRFVSGTYCTMALAELGADVVKIEEPVRGDPTRKWSPEQGAGNNAYFMSVNRSKRSLAIDLRDPVGADLARRMIKRSDVVIHNFRPDSVSPLGLDYASVCAIKPDVIYCSISGYGPQGPYADRPALDFAVQGESGLMSITGAPGGEPVKVPLPISDLLTANMASIAILAALHRRTMVGKGARIAVSMFESLIAAMTNVAADYLVDGVEPQRLGTAHPDIAPYQVFPTAGGSLCLGISSDAHWRTFCEVTGRRDLLADERFASAAGRVAHRTELAELVIEILSHDTARHWASLLTSSGVPSGEVRSVVDALEGDQARALGLVTEVDHPVRGSVKVVRSPIWLDGAPLPAAPAPTLDGHRTAVLRDWLGEEPVNEL